MSLLFRQVSGELGAVWPAVVATVTFVATFVGIAVWAWRPANRQRFEEAARLPLDELPATEDGERSGA